MAERHTYTADPVGCYLTPHVSPAGEGASVVDLKFPSFRWRARWELQIQNHTSFHWVASVLSNPKFAQSQARDIANFGFGTLGGVAPDLQCACRLRQSRPLKRLTARISPKKNGRGHGGNTESWDRLARRFVVPDRLSEHDLAWRTPPITAARRNVPAGSRTP